VRRGRPTILHHHDLPWQRPHLAHIEGPPTDDAWRHVTINELSRRELAERGIHARTIYNTFDTSQRPGDRAGTRKRLGLDEQQRLVLQPTRALARKNIPGGLELAAALGATYWLLGRAEDGYGPELDRLLAETPCPVIRGSGAINDISDAYAAADVITLPSFWEGFGNPTIESVTYRRPLAIGRYRSLGSYSASASSSSTSPSPGVSTNGCAVATPLHSSATSRAPMPTSLSPCSRVASAASWTRSARPSHHRTAHSTANLDVMAALRASEQGRTLPTRRLRCGACQLLSGANSSTPWRSASSPSAAIGPRRWTTSPRRRG